MNIGKLIAGGIKQKKASMGEDWAWGFSSQDNTVQQKAHAKSIQTRQNKALTTQAR